MCSPVAQAETERKGVVVIRVRLSDERIQSEVDANGCWVYRSAVYNTTPDDFAGFVYLITHLPSGMKYIGKKLFWSKIRVTRNGKKKSAERESDWRAYWSSSPVISRMFEEGSQSQDFTREILHLCITRGELGYLELREQMDRRVLEYPELYLNGIVQARINESHIRKAVQQRPHMYRSDR